MTQEQLQAISSTITSKSAETFLPYINQFAEEYEVTTPERMAAFVAQALHESGEFKWVRELSSGKQYEGRADLGNTTPGDGERYKGRGLFQITGRFNYATISKDFFGDADVLLKNPDLLATPQNATRAAYWFWHKHNLNELADAGEFEQITRRINGGLNGQQEREKYYKQALEVLKETV